MTATKYYLACFVGAAAFFSLCYGVIYRATDAILVFVALASLLVVFLWWMFDRAALERRIKRLEARSEIADERRVVAQTHLAEVEHKLENVETRVTATESIK
jgi:membrane protein implicated in regulation of membrane protease activity